MVVRMIIIVIQCDSCMRRTAIGVQHIVITPVPIEGGVKVGIDVQFFSFFFFSFVIAAAADDVVTVIIRIVQQQINLFRRMKE